MTVLLKDCYVERCKLEGGTLGAVQEACRQVKSRGQPGRPGRTEGDGWEGWPHAPPPVRGPEARAEHLRHCSEIVRFVSFFVP